MLARLAATPASLRSALGGLFLGGWSLSFPPLLSARLPLWLRRAVCLSVRPPARRWGLASLPGGCKARLSSCPRLWPPGGTQPPPSPVAAPGPGRAVPPAPRAPRAPRPPGGAQSQAARRTNSIFFTTRGGSTELKIKRRDRYLSAWRLIGRSEARVIAGAGRGRDAAGQGRTGPWARGGRGAGARGAAGRRPGPRAPPGRPPGAPRPRWASHCPEAVAPLPAQPEGGV